MTPNSNSKRLIEVAFPLKQTSLDSVHEKNVRHGHILRRCTYGRHDGHWRRRGPP